MNNVSEHIERLIVRKLDGELTSDEQLELDRELLRSPEAGRLLDEYQKIDTMAERVISASAGQSLSRQPLLVVPETNPSAIAHQHRWMYAGSAIAACLAFLLFWFTPTPDRSSNYGSNNGSKVRPIASPPIAAVGQPTNGFWPRRRGNDVGVYHVSQMAPRPVDRVTDRNFILIPAQDGQYMIKVDHIREVRRSNPRRHTRPLPDPI